MCACVCLLGGEKKIKNKWERQRQKKRETDTEGEDEKLALHDAYRWFALPYLAQAVLSLKFEAINHGPLH